MRVCWNRQTGTFEGRVSSTYGFKSHHSHQIQELPIRVALVFFSIIVMGLEKGDGVAGNNLPVDGCLARGRVAATVAAWRVPSLAPKKTIIL